MLSQLLAHNRRSFLGQAGLGLGSMALADLLSKDGKADDSAAKSTKERGILGQPHFPPKAKRVIYLFMSGGPSQLDLYDYKPLLNQRHGEQLPDSVRGGQRLTGMSGNQSSIPLVGSPFKFAQYGKSGSWLANCYRTQHRLPMSSVLFARCTPRPLIMDLV
jgi:hypothetical protein